MDIFKRFIQHVNPFASKTTTITSAAMSVIPRQQHGISRKHISANALKVLNRLHKAGFSAYLVGGSVRDLLLRHIPKDFDVATNAHPEDVRQLFNNCRLIGRRFRLAHVFFGYDIIEVATFRAHHHNANTAQQAQMRDGQIIRDNVYGSIEEDAERRDFTINALYYNIADGSVVDFSSGMADLKQRIIRIIGDPVQRYQEDPVRMLRAIRFAAKTGFNIEANTEKPLFTHGHLLQNVPKARLFEEVCKLLLCKNSVAVFKQLEHYHMLPYLFPELIAHLDEAADQDNTVAYRTLIERTLLNTEQRIADHKPITPAFLLAAFLWPPLQTRMQQLEQQQMHVLPALDIAAKETLDKQLAVFSIQKRFVMTVREIWRMQYQLHAKHRAPYLTSRLKFRAAYDFLCLRAQSSEPHLSDLANWWTAYQAANDEDKAAMLREIPKPKRRKRRRRPKHKSI